jgi:EAL domain-containing protein (putative c-di-GMP-specific phosphodiesterase class I)/CRP-like cAMP-binding protein
MKNVNSSQSPLKSGVSSATWAGEARCSFDADFAAETACNLCTFEAGDVIFIEGSPADRAYIIEAGLVEIFVGSEDEAIQLNTLGPGDIFGEMGLIDTFPRSASAKALSPCRCIVVSAAQIAERIESSPPMVKMLISMSLHRNRAYNTYLKTHIHPAKNRFIDPVSTDNSYTKSQQYQKILEDIKLESELQSAIQGNELALHYQPLFSLSQSELLGFEALLRWQSQARGLVPPSQFIHIAEETSLIVPIGYWIIEQACIDLKRFQEQRQLTQESPHELFVSVNISVKQFQEPQFLEQLLAITHRHGIAPQQLKLEVTERIFLDTVEAIETIGQCRTAGFEVSLDDFGTGYSSLNYLERCEIDSLKIDQSFIQKLCNSEKSRILVGSIIDISKKLGLPTVAEGIETLEQMSFLRELGCEIGQGYLFSRPVGFNQALSLL